MKVSTIDFNIGDPGEWADEFSGAINDAADQDTATWIEAGGEPVAAIVPASVLLFYARHMGLVPEHDAHSLGGPRECERCSLLRANADWIFTVTSPEVPKIDPRVREAFDAAIEEVGLGPPFTPGEQVEFLSTGRRGHGWYPAVYVGARDNGHRIRTPHQAITVPAENVRKVPT